MRKGDLLCEMMQAGCAQGTVGDSGSRRAHDQTTGRSLERREPRLEGEVQEGSRRERMEGEKGRAKVGEQGGPACGRIEFLWSITSQHIMS